MKKNIIVFDKNEVTSLIVRYIYPESRVMFEEMIENKYDLLTRIRCYKNIDFTVIVFSRDEKEKQYALSCGADLCLTPFVNLSHVKTQVQELTALSKQPFFSAA